MPANDLQIEINHLLFLYFTSIGVIQRDAESECLDKEISEMIMEIARSKIRIDKMLEEKQKESEVAKDYQSIIEDGKKFIEDGFYLIDRVLDKIENR